MPRTSPTLAAGTDLDDVTGGGTYYLGNASYAYVNAPSNNAQLVVLSADTDIITQFVIFRWKSWVRYRSTAGAWQPWRVMADPQA